jgi:hypothetical protein
MFAVDDREHERHDCDLEQRAYDPREPRTQRAFGVQTRTGEQQRREQVREGDEVFALVQRIARRDGAVHRFLEDQGREDRQRERREIQHGQQHEPTDAPQRGGPQQAHQHRLATAADVPAGPRRALRQRGSDALWVHGARGQRPSR